MLDGLELMVDQELNLHKIQGYQILLNMAILAEMVHFTLVAAEAAVVLLERMLKPQVSQITQTNLLLEEMVNLSLYTGDLIGLPSITPYQGGNGSWAGGGGGGSGRDGWVNNKGEADKPPHVPGGAERHQTTTEVTKEIQKQVSWIGWWWVETPTLEDQLQFSRDGGNGIVIIRTG